MIAYDTHLEQMLREFSKQYANNVAHCTAQEAYDFMSTFIDLDSSGAEDLFLDQHHYSSSVLDAFNMFQAGVDFIPQGDE